MSKFERTQLLLLLLLLPWSAGAQGGPRLFLGSGLFPLKEGLAASTENPAFLSHASTPQASLRVHDRFLLPELALQELRANTGMGRGTAFMSLAHFGNELYREGSGYIGYALPVGKNSGMGLAIGASQVRIGDGHGQRTAFRAKAGIRSRSGKDWRWEFAFHDPHALFRSPPHRDLLSPSARVGVGRKWKGGHIWSLQLRKELDRPLAYATRTRLQLREGFQGIAGAVGPPLGPLLGWCIQWENCQVRFLSAWNPRLGFSPELTLFIQRKK